MKDAKEEGVEFITLANPMEYYANDKGQVNKVKIQKMELGEPDASGRRRPVPIEGAEEFIDVDTVVVSVGVSPNPIVPDSLPELKVTSWGTIEVNEETLQSSLLFFFFRGLV